MALNWIVIGITLAFLLIFGIVYAMLVRFISEHHIDGQTAYLVAFGTLVTVAGSAVLIGLQSALLVLLCFSASGLPMVIEYVLRVAAERKRDHDRAHDLARELLR
jgi:hypothetical protein